MNMNEMMDDAALPRAIELYCSADSSDTERSESVNVILLQLHRQKLVSLHGLVTGYLRSYLVSTESWVRMRSTMLIAVILERLPQLKLDENAVGALIRFSLDRYGGDAESGVPCCLALKSLLEFHENECTESNIREIVFKLLTTHFVPSLTQSLRSSIWAVLKICCDKFRSKMSEDDTNLVNLFADALEGEKDPRCLLVALDIGATLIETANFNSTTDAAQAVEKLFDVTWVYFPIVFRPPTNDPFHIKSEDLWEALYRVFRCHPYMGFHVIPMLVDKLQLESPEVALVKVDALQTLKACISAYDIDRYAGLLCEVLEAACMHADMSQIANESCALVTVIVESISKRENAIHVMRLVSHENTSSFSTAWNSFAGALIRSCMTSIQQGIDSMNGRASGRILVSIADASSLGLSQVLNAILPFVKDLFLSASSTYHQRCAAFELMLKLSRTLDPDIDFSAVGNPVSESNRDLLFSLLHGALESELGSQLSDAQRLDPGPVKKRRTDSVSSEDADIISESAILSLKELILRPPSPLLTQEQISKVIASWSSIAHENISECLTRASLDALVECGKAKPFCASQILRVTIPNIDPDSEIAIKLCSIPPVFVDLVPHMMGRAKVSTISRIVEANQSNVEGLEQCCNMDAGAVLVPEILRNVAADSPVSSELVHIVRCVFRNVSSDIQFPVYDFVINSLFHDIFNNVEKLQRVMPIVGAIVACARPETLSRDQRLQHTISQMMHFSVVHGNEISAQCTGSLFNKLSTEGTEQFVTDSLDQLLLLLTDPSSQDNAWTCVVWVSKGLIMRSQASVSKVFTVVLEHLNDSTDTALSRRYASFFGLMVQPDTVLNSWNHCREQLFYKQKLFSQYFKTLASDLENCDHMHSSNHLLSIVKFVEYIPTPVLLQHSEAVVPVTVRALTSNNGIEIQLSALSTLLVIVQSKPELLEAHLGSIIPVLVVLSAYAPGVSAKTRSDAIEILSRFAEFSYQKIHIYRNQVAKGLQLALDDPKRAIRRKAVECRNVWLVLQNV